MSTMMITVSAHPHAMTALPKRKASHEHQIRARLLNRLGIYDKPVSQPTTAAQTRRTRILRGMGVGYTISPSPPDGSAVRPPLGGVQSFSEKLKYPEESNNNIRGRKQSPTRKLSFSDDVTCIPIPMRTEYSERVRSRLWSNRFELQENAQRNAVEFAAEGWNWRNVTEDEGMYICSVSGELVHPVHCQHLEEEPSLERGTSVHE